MRNWLAFTRWWHYPLAALVGLLVLGGLMFALAALLVYPRLPALDTLTDYQPKVPLRVFTSEGALIGEFGEERRALVKIEAVPKMMKQAILASEDDRFYRHGGVDYSGILRAAIANLTARGAKEGASTITMQVARNFFLSSEKTLSRKFSEVLLAFKIERNLSKDKILELYINQIFLGQRAYGFAAAAQVYFGKQLGQLTLAETAMLAGLPKAPSRFNPVVNPKRATARQHYVLRRMRELDYIGESQYQQALSEPLRLNRDQLGYEVSAHYVAEMVRQVMFERYREAAYSKGFRVYTTLRKKDQQAAVDSLRRGVYDYDRRHGYRGAEGHIELPSGNAGVEELLDDALHDVAVVDGLWPAVVTSASSKQVSAYRKGGDAVILKGEALEFAQRMLSDKADPKRRIRRGALIRVKLGANERWQIAQLPAVEAAFVALNPKDGGVLALVGGFDFNRNKFNHATQAWRQPGSSFKPFIYSAALDRGFTASTLINDAPLSLPGGNGTIWSPKNFDNKYSGPTRLRTALTKSKNTVSIRILQAIGTQYARDYITRFGFSPERHPPYLTIALGAGSVTPLEMASAYAVFANGGYRVKPYFIARMLDARGKLLAEANPARAGEGAERAIDARNAFIMTSIMQDVVRFGTAARAMQLKRNDLAGKTGTTNDQVDAWFAGYNSGLVGVAWMGFDQPRSLGGAETGAQAALPIWINFMARALKDVPEAPLEMPDGVVKLWISTGSGLRVAEGAGAVEYYYQENLPAQQPVQTEQPGEAEPTTIEEVIDQLF